MPKNNGSNPENLLRAEFTALYNRCKELNLTMVACVSTDIEHCHFCGLGSDIDMAALLVCAFKEIFARQDYDREEAISVMTMFLKLAYSEAKK